MKNSLQVSRIDFTPRFNRQRKSAPVEIKEALRDAILVFSAEQYNPSLRNHALTKKFAGYRSIDVTGDWRAIFKEKESGKKKVVVFHLLGTHKDLYG